MKLTKNEMKLYTVLKENGKVKQPDLLSIFPGDYPGDYKSEESKRVCISIALNGLKKKGLIKLINKDKDFGIPTNTWEIVNSDLKISKREVLNDNKKVEAIV